MAFKCVALFALVAVAHAGLLPAAQVYHATPAVVAKTIAPVAHYVTQPALAKADDEYDPHPQYKYDYNVQDSISGDSKSQVEERDGDVVRGEYSLIDADGFKRTVQYTADNVHGFNAVVNRVPLVKAAVAPSVVKSVASVPHYAEPAVVRTVAPIAHYSIPTVVKTNAPAAHYSSTTTVKTSSPAAHYAAVAAHYTAPVAHYTAPVAHYDAPAVIKTVVPVAHHADRTVIKAIAPVAHYAPPSYSTYSSPSYYVAHH